MTIATINGEEEPRKGKVSSKGGWSFSGCGSCHLCYGEEREEWEEADEEEREEIINDIAKERGFY